ncbi:MAG: molecular chaperone DnaJ [Nitrospinota bacterium]|nr:MAG: molecular chaperone DnaJ [Nitrospinota bacterium]
MQDYYELLGISPQAGEKEVRRAYRRLARQYHPEINPGDREAEKKFKEIAEAFRVLSDPVLREQYDRLGPHLFRRLRTTPPHGKGAGETFSAAGWEEDPFPDLFKRQQPPSFRHPTTRRLASPPTVELSLEEAVHGTRKELAIPVERPCPSCHRPGTEAEKGLLPCPACQGTGRQALLPGTVGPGYPCPRCAGQGSIRPGCPRCHGQGMTVEMERCTVEIPPGVGDGTRIRVTMRGKAVRKEERREGLYITTRIRPHPLFHRKGNDLYSSLPLSIAQAALGSRVEVPTIDGPLLLTIPPGTQGGQTFCLRGKGVPYRKGKGRGDHYITVVIRIPQHLDQRSIELIRELEKRTQR